LFWVLYVVCGCGRSDDFGLVGLLIFWDSLCCFGVCCFCCFAGLCILRFGFCGVCVGIMRKLVCLLLWWNLWFCEFWLGGLVGVLVVLVICCDFGVGVDLVWHNWFGFVCVFVLGLCLCGVGFCGFLRFWFALLGGYVAGLCTWFMFCWIIVLRNFLFIFEFGLLLEGLFVQVCFVCFCWRLWCGVCLWLVCFCCFSCLAVCLRGWFCCLVYLDFVCSTLLVFVLNLLWFVSWFGFSDYGFCGLDIIVIVLWL